MMEVLERRDATPTPFVRSVFGLRRLNDYIRLHSITHADLCPRLSVGDAADISQCTVIETSSRGYTAQSQCTSSSNCGNGSFIESTLNVVLTIFLHKPYPFHSR